jgi:hypothetical protein
MADGPRIPGRSSAGVRPPEEGRARRTISIGNIERVTSKPALLLMHSSMNNEAETEGRRRQDRRRGDPHNDETPVSRPNDEVPANRREDSKRTDGDDEQERKDRRRS